MQKWTEMHFLRVQFSFLKFRLKTKKNKIFRIPTFYLKYSCNLLNVWTHLKIKWKSFLFTKNYKNKKKIFHIYTKNSTKQKIKNARNSKSRIQTKKMTTKPDLTTRCVYVVPLAPIENASHSTSKVIQSTKLYQATMKIRCLNSAR